MKAPKTTTPKDSPRSWWQKLTHFNIKDEEHALFSAFIVVLLAIIVVNTLYILNHQNALNNNSHQTTDVISKPQKVFTSQQTAISPVYHIVISDVTENSTYDPAFVIPSNETMLILKLTVTNTSQGDQNFVPSQQLYVRSLDGDYAGMHASMYVTNPIPATTLKPNQTVSGQISFDIPKTQSRPLLYVDLGWNNYGPVVFDVLH